MRRVLISLAVTLFAAVVLLGGLSSFGGWRIANPPPVVTSGVEAIDAKHAIQRGKHLAHAVAGCADCHGPGLGGKVMDHAPPTVRLTAPNLTPGEGGVVGKYTDETWLRALVHGVGGDGEALVSMPSEYYAKMPADEIGALIGYLKTLPPVNNHLPSTDLGFLGNIIFGVFDYSNLPINRIEHNSVGMSTIDPKQGEYLASMSGCTSCHGKRLAGLTSDLGPPPGPNLTSLDWTSAQFRHSLDSGERPDGTLMNSVMPWQTLANMTREETDAVWAYVLEQPERALGDND